MTTDQKPSAPQGQLVALDVAPSETEASDQDILARFAAAGCGGCSTLSELAWSLTPDQADKLMQHPILIAWIADQLVRFSLEEEPFITHVVGPDRYQPFTRAVAECLLHAPTCLLRRTSHGEQVWRGAELPPGAEVLVVEPFIWHETYLTEVLYAIAGTHERFGSNPTCHTVLTCVNHTGCLYPIDDCYSIEVLSFL